MNRCLVCETKGFKIAINSQNLGIEILFEPREKIYLPKYVIYGLPRVFRGAKRANTARTTHNTAILCRVHAGKERTFEITWH